MKRTAGTSLNPIFIDDDQGSSLDNPIVFDDQDDNSTPTQVPPTKKRKRTKALQTRSAVKEPPHHPPALLNQIQNTKQNQNQKIPQQQTQKQNRKQNRQGNGSSLLSKNNFGYKMLQRFGWAEGQGLGVGGAGMTEPLAPPRNIGTLGLGASRPSGHKVSAQPSRATKFTNSQMGGYNLDHVLCPEYLRLGFCSQPFSCMYNHGDLNPTIPHAITPTAPRRPQQLSGGGALDSAYHNPAHFPDLPYDDVPEESEAQRPLQQQMIQSDAFPSWSAPMLMGMRYPDFFSFNDVPQPILSGSLAQGSGTTISETSDHPVGEKHERNRRRAERRKQNRQAATIKEQANHPASLRTKRSVEALKQMKKDMGGVRKDVNGAKLSGHALATLPARPSNATASLASNFVANPKNSFAPIVPQASDAPEPKVSLPERPKSASPGYSDRTIAPLPSRLSVAIQTPMHPSLPPKPQVQIQTQVQIQAQAPPPDPARLRNLETRMAELKVLMHRLESAKTVEEKRSLMALVKEKHQAVTNAKEGLSIPISSATTVTNSVTTPTSSMTTSMTLKSKPFMRLPNFTTFVIELTDDEDED